LGGVIGVADDEEDEDPPDGGATTAGTLTINGIIRGVASLLPAASIDMTVIVCVPLARAT
jgi:hypothetical protein